PPTPTPFASRAMVAGGPGRTSRRGDDWGAFPPRTQRSRAANAAFSTKCSGPELIGRPQSMMPGVGDVVRTRPTTAGDRPVSVGAVETRYASACDVPATSHVR